MHRTLRPVLVGLGTATAIAALIVAAPLAATAAEPEPGDDALFGTTEAYAIIVDAPLATTAAAPGDDDFLGTAEAYAIISGNSITVTPTLGTLVTGDVGLTPGTSQGLAAGQVIGAIRVGPDAEDADADLNTAYVILANASATSTVGATDLALRTTPYGPGVYFSGSSLLLDGTMTLDGGANDVFIFQASTGELITGTNSRVLLIGQVQACNVYWQVGSSATLGVNSVFVGSILAATSIEALTGAQVTGQLLAGATIAGAVTLDSNVINSGSLCVRTASSPDGSSGGSTGGSTGGSSGTLAATGFEPMPTLASAALLTIAGFGAILFSRRVRAMPAQD